MNLIPYGWHTGIEKELDKVERKGSDIARITAVHRHLYEMVTDQGFLIGELTGKRKFEIVSQDEYPTVGDWVVFDPLQGGERGMIQEILKRKSKLSRKVAGAEAEEQLMAANVDYIFLVNALNQDYNPRKIERFLLMAWESGAQPVVLLSKADLQENALEMKIEVEGIAPGVPVHTVSAQTGQGLDELNQYIQPGKTIVLLGASGVGKSTLVNYLFGEEQMATQGVRQGDDRGRHTTTHRQLVLLPRGGLIIDTPGIREMQLWGGEQGVAGAFEDIEALGTQCYFSDCQHIHEPRCAVKAAIQDGRLQVERFNNYRKLLREMKYLEEKQQRNDGKQRKKTRK